jgi:hypothetical protein
MDLGEYASHGVYHFVEIVFCVLFAKVRVAFQEYPQREPSLQHTVLQKTPGGQPSPVAQQSAPVAPHEGRALSANALIVEEAE